MKKMIIIVVLIGLTSCKKEEIKLNCDCGVITEIVWTEIEQGFQASYKIKNNCSGNTQEFELSGDHKTNSKVCLDSKW